MMNISNDLDETLTVDCLVLDNIEACASLLPYENNFKLLTFNIRSLQHNFDSFLVTLKRVNIDLDIIILTECWLSESSLIPQISGYYSYRTFKHINKSGGVTAYVKDTLNANVSEPLFEDCIYRSPSFLDIDPFLLSLNNALKNASKIPNIILAGDLNIDIYPMPHYLLPYVYNVVCRKLELRYLTTHQLKQVMEPWLCELDYLQTESLINAVS
ncbi:hypothetical protein ABMA27_005428 [Loxostege sticticalis]|uniref:Endonuclease/exonuclease/phosphatase domain-containing protein n=1 Tax=Loxostege sticticalis TaxID=481309 RepID=A0ABR3HJ44_LOXSC